MNYTDEAIKKMTKEAGNNTNLVRFEEHLTELCKTESVAKKILNNDKTLDKAYEEIKGKAKAKAVNGCACIPDEEVFEMLEEYYGITADDKEKKVNVIDITELL